MQLGNFSISLTVQDLAASKKFYETLGFETHGGDGTSYVMLKNGTTILGLFQGMFEKNILTFNPKWDHECKHLPDAEDVRALRNRLVEQGVELLSDTTQDSASGPANFVLEDPDGNPILVDQHV